jgi:hypothetical protein
MKCFSKITKTLINSKNNKLFINSGLLSNKIQETNIQKLNYKKKQIDIKNIKQNIVLWGYEDKDDDR